MAGSPRPGGIPQQKFDDLPVERQHEVVTQALQRAHSSVDQADKARIGSFTEKLRQLEAQLAAKANGAEE
jgi:hypothetical protein